MGKSQREKGARFEREMVHKFSDAGMPAKRVPLSGATPWLKGDLIVDIRGVERTVELKKRGDGFKQLYDWLGDNYGLIVAADRRPPLVVVPFDAFAELAADHD